jgi:1-acyl-sn-glycerol-3-phosphate acyltransferase
MSWYRFFRGMFRYFYRIFFFPKVIGLHHIPSDGSVILCCNHINNLDPPLLGSPVERQVFFMAKEELFRIPVLSFLLTRFGAFPVKRGSTDRSALKRTLGILKEGHILGIFPEGHRSKTGNLGKPYPGTALFALKSTATVIPVAIVGPWKWFRSIKIVYGEPIDLTAYRERKVTSELTTEVSALIMKEIQNLLDQHR